MPKLDIIHNAVKNALIKDGWLVTDDPYVIQYRRTVLYADLGAEHPIAVERDGQKLVVEVKSFVGASKIQDLKEALGQYDIYRQRKQLQTVSCTLLLAKLRTIPFLLKM